MFWSRKLVVATPAWAVCMIGLSAAVMFSPRVHGYFPQDDSDQSAVAATVIHLNRPVISVSKTLANLFDPDSSLRLVPDQESNILIVKGEQVDVRRAVEILKRIDEPQPMVTVNVRIEVAGAGDLSDEFQLTTLSDMKAHLQVGQQQTVPSGSIQQFGGRSVSRSYQKENTGTIVQVTPRVSGEQILLDLSVEKSWLEYPAALETDDDDQIRVPTTLTSTLETTVRLGLNESRTMTASVSSVAGVSREVAITVSATTGRPADRIQNAQRPSSAQRAGGGSGPGPALRGPAVPGQPNVQAFNEIAKRLMSRYDADGNGVLNREEWKNSGAFGTGIESRGFRFDGDLTAEDFGKILREFGPTNRSRSGSSRGRAGSTGRSGRASSGDNPSSAPDDAAEENKESDAADDVE